VGKRLSDVGVSNRRNANSQLKPTTPYLTTESGCPCFAESVITAPEPGVSANGVLVKLCSLVPLQALKANIITVQKIKKSFFMACWFYSTTGGII